MRALSVELAAKGVTVNAVCPGYTETPLLDAAANKISAKTGRRADDARAELAKDNAHGRLITPEEVAQTVLWLCSPAASRSTARPSPSQEDRYEGRRKTRNRAASQPASKQRLRLWLRLLRATRAIEAELRERLRVQFAITLPQFDVHGGALAPGRTAST